jgi:hypothetical protein
MSTADLIRGMAREQEDEKKTALIEFFPSFFYNQ